MGSCHWLWNNIRWVLDITYPNDCPDGQHCDPPTADGTYYGEPAVTSCAL